MIDNPYLDFAESVLPSPRRQTVRTVPSEAHAPMVLRGAEKALAERSKQLAKAKRWTKAELKAIFEGPWGTLVKRVINFLHHMTINNGADLLAFLEQLKWLRDVDHDTRMHVLAEIDDAIITLRICAGLSPIDDALPGEELTVFQMIRQKLNHEEAYNEHRRESSEGIR